MEKYNEFVGQQLVESDLPEVNSGRQIPYEEVRQLHQNFDADRIN